MRVPRVTRLQMLLTSLEDAKAGLEGRTEEQVRRGSPGSRSLERRGEARKLWKQGSYAELEEALGRLSHDQHEALYYAFIWHPSVRERRVRAQFKAQNKDLIDKALEVLGELMPARIYVPKDVRDNWFDYVAEDRKGRLSVR